MRLTMRTSTRVLLLITLIGIAAPSAMADIVGPVLTFPNTTVFPGAATGTPGTLVAHTKQNYSYTTTAGTTSGTIESAVYLQSNGLLDFFYQVNNSASSATSIERLSNTSFTGFVTSTGFLLNGSTLSGTTFVNGTVAPATADRDISGAVVGFNFFVPNEIGPGQSSNVIVIATNAANFVVGNSEVLDGGSFTTTTFQPAAAPTVPEPSSLALLGSGLISFAGVIRRKLS